MEKKMTARSARDITQEAREKALNTKEVKFAIKFAEGKIEEAANKCFKSVTVALFDLCEDQNVTPKFALLPSESTVLCVKGELQNRGFQVEEKYLNHYGNSVRHFIISW